MVRIAALCLLVCALAHGQAGLQVLPAASVLPAGKTLAFSAAPHACAWSLPGGLGSIDAQGVFTAPALAETTLVVVRASSLADPGATGEASVLVLRDDPSLANLWETVANTQGLEVWRPFRVGGLPFMDADTGLRFEPSADVTERHGLRAPPLTQWLGYGLPVPIRWDRLLADADGLLLSLREGDDLLRFNATGQPSQVVQLTGRIREGALEVLRRRDPAAGTWTSAQVPLKVQVRGMVPLAGNPAAEPGHRDGRGLGARFRKPWGLAMLGSKQDGTSLLAVADVEDHVIRTITPGGETKTLCGGPGLEGYHDGPGAQARFRGPTFLAAKPEAFDARAWSFTTTFIVADSGNHAIRCVDGQGKVTTLAGGGTPGYVDSDRPQEARFNNPQGVAVDADFNVYVADRGNFVIRKIDRCGRVSTFAGNGARGFRDGEAAQAQFADLKGLALVNAVLCVADGHSLRTVTTIRGWRQVETLLGWAQDAGSELGGILSLEEAHGPALNGPCGLAAFHGRLLVADEGNHAVRIIRQEPLYYEYQCTTVAGDPGTGAIRWGLLRDGLPWRPGPAYAALKAPRGVTFDGAGGAYVATGPCVVHLSGSDAFEPPMRLRVERDHREEEGFAATLGKPLPLDSLGLPADVKPHEVHRVTLECLDRDSGEAYLDLEVLEPGPVGRDGRLIVFKRKGRVETRLTVLTESGFTQGFRKHVTVGE